MGRRELKGKIRDGTKSDEGDPAMGYCVGKGASRAQGDERRKKRMKNSEIKGVKAITRLKPYYKDNKKGQKSDKKSAQPEAQERHK